MGAQIIQLYEMIVVRHGLMLVGQSFGMKTSAIRWVWLLVHTLGFTHSLALCCFLADSERTVSDSVGMTRQRLMEPLVGSHYPVCLNHAGTGPTLSSSWMLPPGKAQTLNSMVHMVETAWCLQH